MRLLLNQPNRLLSGGAIIGADYYCRRPAAELTINYYYRPGAAGPTIVAACQIINIIIIINLPARRSQ